MKTYCISDVHGHLDNLYFFVKTLNEDDRVFVLGDAIDKGPMSLGCLQYIMADTRFKMLLGNHEYMMFNLLNSKLGTREYNEAYEQWINWNVGEETLKQFIALPHHEQLKIFNYIDNLPLNIPNVEVNGRKYYLVHSCPSSNLSYKMKDLEYNDKKICEYVWERVNPEDTFNIGEDVTVIAGHTMVQFYVGLDAKEISPVFDGKDIKKAKYIDIDGGLASQLDNARLISLCLDDLSYKLVTVHTPN